MATIRLHDPLQEVHGKLSKKNGRVEYKHRRDSGIRYTGMRQKLTRRKKALRKEQRSAAQKAITSKFAAVATSTRTRMSDSTKKAADLEAFKKQQLYPTLFGYLFHLEWEAYNE